MKTIALGAFSGALAWTFREEIWEMFRKADAVLCTVIDEFSFSLE